jgi:hypothetical protein
MPKIPIKAAIAATIRNPPISFGPMEILLSIMILL